MYTIDDLNVRLLSELKDIADGMGVKNAKKLAKQELVYKILDQQAAAGEPAPTKKSEESDKKIRPRRRENVAPPAPPAPAPKGNSSEEMHQPVDLDVEQPVTRFDGNSSKFEESSQQPPASQHQNNGDGHQKNENQQRDDRQQQQRIINIKDFDGAITNEGVLELMQDGYGFLR